MNKYKLLRMLVVFALLGVMSIVASAQQSSSYIIVFNDNVRMSPAQGQGFADAYGLQVSYLYRTALNGMAANVPAGRINALRNDPRVAYVEADLLMSIDVQEMPTGIDRSFASGNSNLDIDGTDDFRVDVDVAILDTGIDLEHPDLNVVGGIDCTLVQGGGPFATRYCGIGNGGDDDHYHGTHVAGTVGALDNNIGVVGVAPGARLWAVKVLDSRGSGYTSGIIAGIDWVVAQGNIEVANMSLGGSGISEAYRDAIDNAVANGVVMVVAAGNSAADANNYSPAFVPSAITVSALADFDGLEGALGSPTCRADEDDTLANFSNFGSAVDIAAPGVCILSTYPLEQGEYASISGTSMAAPHVAGAAALLASGSNSPSNAADVQAIRDTLVNTGNVNYTDDSGDGIQEKLLDLSNENIFNPVLVLGDGGPVGNQSPTASFTYACNELACNFTDTSVDGDGSIASVAWDFGDNATAGNVSSPSHTYAADGTYTVTLTVIDNEGAIDTTTNSVTVSAGSTGDGVSISSLSGSVNNDGGSWSASVVITVVNGGTPVSGAVVAGSFDVGGDTQCTTGANGTCTVTSNSVRKRDASAITFTASSITVGGNVTSVSDSTTVTR